MASPPVSSACARIVKQQDPDRFLTCLFAGTAEREALFALYAFNHEIAKIRETVREPMLGQIRLQWWRDTIGECYGDKTARRHEVVQPLEQAITRYGLTRDWLEQLIDARESDLVSKRFQTLDAFSHYATMTGASLMYLACEIFDRRDENARQIAKVTGTCWAMLGMMRALPFYIQTGSDRLPHDMLKKYGLDKKTSAPSEAINNLVKEICGDIETRLSRVLVDKQYYCPPLLLKTLSVEYCRQFKKAGYDPFSGKMAQASPWRIIRLYSAAFLKRF